VAVVDSLAEALHPNRYQKELDVQQRNLNAQTKGNTNKEKRQTQRGASQKGLSCDPNLL
jgi:hypothetical protein